jgi:hypothetical protein
MATMQVRSNYTIYVHRDTELPLQGLGYFEERRQEVIDQVTRWNSYTVETCPHKDILHGQDCKLCGSKWVLSTV